MTTKQVQRTYGPQMLRPPIKPAQEQAGVSSPPASPLHRDYFVFNVCATGIVLIMYCAIVYKVAVIVADKMGW